MSRRLAGIIIIMSQYDVTAEFVKYADESFYCSIKTPLQLLSQL